MLPWLQALVNGTCTLLVLMFELEGKVGHIFRIGVVLCLAMSVAVLYNGFQHVATDLHVRFWLGSWPKVAVAGDVILFTVILIVVVWLEWAHFVRHRQNKRLTSHVGIMDCGLGMCGRWMSTRKELQRMSMSVAFVGLMVAVLGATVTTKGTMICETLVEKCGSEPSSRELDATFDKLSAFYSTCDGGTRVRPVRACPGFNQTFPPPAPMVRYLEVLEVKERCSGFCKFAKKPVFSSVGSGRAQAAFPVRCASVLGQEMRKIALLTGVPTMSFGIAVAVLATCMSAYEDL